MWSGPDITAPAGCCCHSYRPITQPPTPSGGSIKWLCVVTCSGLGYEGWWGGGGGTPEKSPMPELSKDGALHYTNTTHRERLAPRRTEGWMLNRAKNRATVRPPDGASTDQIELQSVDRDFFLSPSLAPSFPLSFLSFIRSQISIKRIGKENYRK